MMKLKYKVELYIIKEKEQLSGNLMSSSKSVIYPPKEILNPPFGKNFEYIILWMLNENNYCTWSDFAEEISISTLSGKLKHLLKQEYVEKSERNRYQITPKGREKLNEISLPKEIKRTLRYPPKLILRKRNYDHVILWMVNNNPYCKWSDFLENPLSINQSSLSKNLRMLIEAGFVVNENKAYKVTPAGKVEYLKTLKLYDLDRQSILDEESRRIEEITKKTIIFFENYDIEDDNIKFRFLNNILKFNYEIVQDRIKDEEEFYKILLYLSINHPNQYPEYISIEDFAFKYDIEKRILDYYIYEIIENQENPLYSIKFFKLEDREGNIYYFQKDELLEKALNIIAEEHITKFTYLNKLYEGTSNGHEPIKIEHVLNDILANICNSLFNEGLKDSLRNFLPEYIEYLAYKIKADKKLVDQSAKMEGVAWQNFYSNFQTFDISAARIQNGDGEDYFILDHKIFDILGPYYLSKINFIKNKDFENDYFSIENLQKIRKIEDLLIRGKVVKAKNIFNDTIEELKEIEKLILEDLIATFQNDFEDSIKLTTIIIAKYSNSYAGYLLQSLTYFKMNEIEKATKVIEEGLGISNNVSLICQQVQFLIKKLEYDNALEILDNSLSENPNNTHLLRLKSILYLINKELYDLDPEEPMNLLNSVIKLKPDDLDLLILKAVFLCIQSKYKETKKFLFKEIGFNVFTENPRIDTSAFFILAYSYIARGRFEKALKRSNQVLIHYENHPTSYLTKAMVLGYNLIYKFILRESDEEEFIEMIDITIKLDPSKSNKARYYELKSRVLQEIRGFQEALNVIDTAIKLDPYKLDLNDTKLRLLLANNRDEDVLILLDQLFEKKPTRKKQYYQAKSFLLYKMSKYEESLNVINEIIDLYPNDSSLLNNRIIMLAHYAITLKNKGKKEEFLRIKDDAIATAEKLISIAPKIGNFYDSFGEILMMFEDYEDALEQFQKALKLEPHGWFAFDTTAKMGNCYKGLGDLEKAIEFFEKAQFLSERMLPGKRNGYLSKKIEFQEEIKQLKQKLGKNP